MSTAWRAGSWPPEVRAVMRAWWRQQSALANETARFFVGLELTMAQFRALATIHRSGRLTGRELAQRLRVTPGTLVPLVDRLEEQGYLRRAPDQQDRRVTWLEMTPRGERLFERLRGGGGRVMAAILHLEPEDRRVLGRLLNQIADHLEADHPEPERPLEVAARQRSHDSSRRHARAGIE
jgi:DNA-binding MarR family transcriptional regulator